LNPLCQRLLRAVALSLSFAALTAITVYIVSYLLYPVTGIEVRGARMFPETSAWRAVPDRASLLTLNPSTLERRVESNPWVQGAKVSKDWESGIVTVEVEERRPVLYGEMGGRTFFMSADGTELTALGAADLRKVRLDEKRLEVILEFCRVLEGNGVALDSIDAAGPGGVRATVAGRQVVFAGGVDDTQARVLVEVMEDNPKAPLFDLRSPRRVVVGADRANGEPQG
jgi:hypothetical protein